MLVKWNSSYLALNQIRGSLFPSKEEKNNSLVNNIRQSSGVLYFIYLWYNLKSNIYATKCWKLWPTFRKQRDFFFWTSSNDFT